MINRTLLRTKVVQTLFAFYKNEGKTALTAEKELMLSFQKTYDLYFYLLLLIPEITRYADLRIEAGRNKLLPTDAERNPSMRFANNLFAAQVAENNTLNKHVAESKLSWADSPEIVKELYTQIQAADFFAEYMSSDTCSYDADRTLWRQIFSKIILCDETLADALENQCAYWTADVDVIGSFVLKTIKRFAPQNGADQELLPMFSSDDDVAFARSLLKNALAKHDEYKQLIDQHTQNWDMGRLAYMDVIIMQAALAEICTVPTIPVNVSINEYMEIAKEYSTDKSAKFINGVLDDIVHQLKKENKLIKAVILQAYDK